MTSTTLPAALPPVPASPAAFRPRTGRVTAAGTALAVAVTPLVVGVLVAKGLSVDPHAPVNALIAGGGRRAGLPRAEWSRRCHTTVRRLKAVRRTTARRCAHVYGHRSAGAGSQAERCAAARISSRAYGRRGPAA
ncbi:hypothetical protein ACIQM4_19220 [Streptomyces sp. NPDC091272]|uniref:hypothetical protein n=1 Tax=Streptomyces sp. NPDC091272 TaxID=3365981 RepID=UPI0038054F86